MLGGHREAPAPPPGRWRPPWSRLRRSGLVRTPRGPRGRGPLSWPACLYLETEDDSGPGWRLQTMVLEPDWSTAGSVPTLDVQVPGNR